MYIIIRDTIHYDLNYMLNGRNISALQSQRQTYIIMYKSIRNEGGGGNKIYPNVSFFRKDTRTYKHV